MSGKDFKIKKISMSNTKQEMLEAYNSLLKQLQERSERELKPKEMLERKAKKEILGVVDGLSSEGVIQEINALKLQVGKLLIQLSQKLEEEVDKYKKVKQAIEIKEKELQEVYEIHREAHTLSALIEAQSQRRKEFEIEMFTKKEELNREIQRIRKEWEEEKKSYEKRLKEQSMEEAKRRQREREEYEYAFKREQKLARDKFEDEKARQEREIQIKRENMERELSERENKIKEREKEFEEMQKKVESFSKEMEVAVNKAVKETTERLQAQAKSREELLRKVFEGERNVLVTKIESLQEIVKQQKEQIAKLSQQLEKAYQKVQDIAIKAVEGSSEISSLVKSQQTVSTGRKQNQEG